jgi:hypothetical protein
MTRKSAIYNQAAALAAECREAYRTYLEWRYEQAEEATNGRMVTKRGMARGVTGWQLLCGPGVFLRRRAYASDELLDFLDRNPVLTAQQFERLWLAGVTTNGTLTVFLSRKQFAERIGVKPDSLARYRLPEPDVIIDNVRGWLPETVDAWQANRSGR